MLLFFNFIIIYSVFSTGHFFIISLDSNVCLISVLVTLKIAYVICAVGNALAGYIILDDECVCGICMS